MHLRRATDATDQLSRAIPDIKLAILAAQLKNASYYAPPYEAEYFSAVERRWGKNILIRGQNRANIEDRVCWSVLASECDFDHLIIAARGGIHESLDRSTSLGPSPEGTYFPSR